MPRSKPRSGWSPGIEPEPTRSGTTQLELAINDFTRQIGIRLAGELVVGLSPEQAVSLGQALIRVGDDQGFERDNDERNAGRDA